jgi:NAD(P)-dependent dehydrogenase (short-subunit alcohol dehydrogenase family)|tara:strand:- start:375 stop:1205 length:831 start_codon:yes stop_codon:yes gene_type:complete
MKNTFDLSNKTILVTGGAGLLGRQHVEAIVEHGGTVVVADINLSAAAALCKEINKKYSKDPTAVVAYAEYMDVLDKDSIARVAEKYKKIDVLINNAAKDTKVEKEGDLNLDARFETMSYDYWKKDMQVGLDGCFLCSQIFANKMVKDGGGSIINIASDLSVIAPDQRIYKKEGVEEMSQYVKPVTYSVSKWAVHGLTKYMATYFADKNIRVNSLSPAGIYSPTLPDDFVDKLTSLIPMGRMAAHNEYKGAIVFLCSAASSYMTGANIVIDGGRSIW